MMTNLRKYQAGVIAITELTLIEDNTNICSKNNDLIQTLQIKRENTHPQILKPDSSIQASSR
jgi:hypothetical protein